MTAIRVLVAIAVVCVAGPAVAQDDMVPVPAAAEEPVPPTFGMLTKFDQHHRGDFDFGVQLLSDEVVPDAWAWRVDLYGQYGTPTRGYYGSAMMANLKGDGGSIGGLGNLEGGVYFISPSGSGQLILRAGLQLPTAADEFDAYGNFITVFQRLPDFPTAFPDGIIPRGSVSLVGNSGSIQYRIEGGLDVMLLYDDSLYDDPVEVIVNASAGVGTRSGNMFISGELSNIGILTESQGDFTDRFLHAAGLQVKYLGTMVHPSLSFISPLDSDVIGEIFIFVLGVELVQMP